ncbi:4feb3450-751b-42e5-9a76-dfc25dded680 [Thermothielavioides terrestris]|uniref:4feb3450-751b-42e5-9a76-dfc25dded680 n=1 Tax=Thermothielavioides terrestris TaxID=2587410 RepID=A0A446B8A2_9PEZI|nr:4feb3450-751b-42e5-9a76-dfc25dded680 [Thermothielavioides terrestris]
MAMTASMTRSRRAEAFHLPNPNPKVAANTNRRLLASAKEQPALHINSSLRKRPPPEHDLETNASKRARLTTGIAVEIPAKPPVYTRFSNKPADAKPAAPPPPPKHAAARPSNPPAGRRAAPHSTDDGPKTAPASARGTRQQPGVTKHREKVANGLKHELNKLQPTAADTRGQGRKLRSQEAIRFKSELSAYFPEYDEVIGNDPKETHILNIDTPIIISLDGAPPPSSSSKNPNPADAANYPVRSYGDALYTDLFDAQRIDFSFLNTNSNSNPGHNNNKSNPGSSSPAPSLSSSDPLPDSLFIPAHKKAERLERSIRNSEKGRAQHERDQIIRLLDGLQGPDWLRVMGVSGITESKKRQFEPARAHFVRGCEAILDKFRRWAAEEKRRRVEAAAGRRAAQREGAAGEREEGGEQQQEEEKSAASEEAEDEREEGEEEVADSEEDGDEEEEDEEGGGGDEDDDEEGPDPEGDPPDDSDVDRKIAKQLREEALAAAAAARQKKKRSTAKRGAARRKAAAPPSRRRLSAAKSPPEEAPREFTSFFAKRYQREAALSKTRRRGRTVLAWGHPVPEPPEAEFELPAELRDEDTLRSHARRKRRDRRLRR